MTDTENARHQALWLAARNGTATDDELRELAQLKAQLRRELNRRGR